MFPVVVELAERVGATVKVGLLVIRVLELDNVDEVSALVCAAIVVLVELLFANACRGTCRALTAPPSVVKVHRYFSPMFGVDSGRIVTPTMQYLFDQCTIVIARISRKVQMQRAIKRPKQVAGCSGQMRMAQGPLRL